MRMDHRLSILVQRLSGSGRSVVARFQCLLPQFGDFGVIFVILELREIFSLTS